MKVNLIKKAKKEYRYPVVAIARVIEKDCKEFLLYSVYMRLDESDKEEVCKQISVLACSLDNLGIKGAFELYSKLALHSIMQEFTYFWRRLKSSEKTKILREKDPVALALIKMLDNQLN